MQSLSRHPKKGGKVLVFLPTTKIHLHLQGLGREVCKPLRQQHRPQEDIHHINVYTIKAKDLDHTVTIAAFINGLRDKDFTKSLTKKLPKIFLDLLLKVEKYLKDRKSVV